MKNWSFGMDNDNLVNLVLAGKKSQQHVYIMKKTFLQ